MTALLGKLRGKARADRSESIQETQAFAGALSSDHAPVASLKGEPVDSSKHPIMAFTYPPGSSPLPRYTIRRGIGVGGFGEVYFAVSEAGKEVALKRIQRNLEVELRGVSHCLNLKHPNLVSLYDICRDDSDQAWVVMEFVAGKNLRQTLDESPTGLAESEVRRWFAGIAAAVHHLHCAGLVHRDLKPGNVFDDLGIVKVGDYGLSKFISASHRGGHTESVGTFHYMAPEIGRGQYGREIDVYALGIMLYELLTGTVPFDGESCHEIIVKHMTAKPDLANIRDPYRSVIAKALAKDPSTRYRSAAEMCDALGMTGSLGRTAVTEATSSAVDETASVSSELQPIVASLASDQRQASSQQVPVAAPFDSASPVGNHASQLEKSPGDSVPASQSEPLARAINESVADLKGWWRSLDQSPFAKLFLITTASFVLIVNTRWLMPLLMLIGIFYVPYYIIRQMLLQAKQQPSYARAQRLAAVSPSSSRPLTRSQWREQMRAHLKAKRSIDRAAELSTSWITATLIAVLLTIAAGVIGLRSGPVNALVVAPYGAILVVVMVASLAILALGKLWELDDGESLPRRLVLAGVGAGVGIFAYMIGHFLMLPIDAGLSRDIESTTLPQALYAAEGVPHAAALMTHFALLFALLRWWKTVDPLRRYRLSLWSVAVAVVAEWAVHQFLPIPQPAGMLTAGGIAIVIQMASPWINPRISPAPLTMNRLPETPNPRPAQFVNARGIA